jgi:HlyD family secretion protein
MFGTAGDDADAFSWDPVSRGELRETIQASGEIQAKTRINIGTNVSGEIKGIHVRDGQDVKAGQLLVSIDQVRLKQQLFQVEALLDVAQKDAARLEAAMRRARENSHRTESLFKDGLISDEDYRQSKLAEESAELSYQSAKANIVQNQANVAGMRDGLDKTTIVAPISGRVTALKAQMGEMAIPGMSNLPGATLMIISDMKEMIAEIKVNESEVVRLKMGQTVQVNVESLPGRVFLGKVYEIASASEQSGQNANMYNVKVALGTSNPDTRLLRPGMSARGVILTAAVKGALRVPLQAVLERDGSLDEAVKKGLLGPESRSVVMVLKDGRARERTIKTGIANTQFYEIEEGLSEGDKVLTGPSKKLKELKDGASVTLRKKSDTQVEKEVHQLQTTGS